jgi:hypothetical protein
VNRFRAHDALKIGGIDPLDPDSLTSILRREGFLTSERVSNAEVFSAKTLKVSKVARLRIEYEPSGSAAAPKTLFVKLSKSPEDKQIFDTKTEAMFYQTVGKSMAGPPIIRCLDVGVSENADSSYLLMEDLTETHFQPDTPQAPSLQYSELAIKCLAEFHAAWWEHPRLGDGVGDYFDRQWLKSFVEDLGRSFERFAGSVNLAEDRCRVYERVLAASPSIWGRLTEQHGLTVTNGDTHWWNFLYPNDPVVGEVRLFDWQLWHLDLGARDLAFLVALGGFAERRPELEQRLVELYFSTLVENGVTNYSREEFLFDYRHSAIRNLNIPVIYWAQGRDEEEWRTLLERAFEAFDVLQCGELI